MTFVNEKGGFVRVAESEKYAELYNKATGKNISFINEQWTIDREREMLLICVYKHRQDMYEGDFGLSDWLFYWHDAWIAFTQKDGNDGKISDVHWQITRTITKIEMPLVVKKNQLEMFRDLKDAFLVYRIGGVFSTKDYRFDLTLDLSEVF
jgi:hypothetical protein